MDVLDISLIKLNVKANNKEDLLKEISQLAFQNGRITDANKFLSDMKKREEQGPTAFGSLIAIPHGKSTTVKEPFLGFIRPEKSIDWGDEEVKLIFFIGVDYEGAKKLHLEIVAAISRKLIEDDFRDELLKVNSENEVLTILTNALKEN
jgi:fructose PTS system EIIA component